MTNTVLLDNVSHHDLKVRTGHSANFGDAVNMAMVFPTEFPFVQREYPILFRRETNGDFQAVVLLGFDKGENLFLDASGWNARYVPAVQERGPFLIGLHGAKDGVDEPEPMIHVDLDHPRVNRHEGESVFLRHGGHSPYLKRINRILQLIFHGAELARPMFAAFEEAGLIEAMEAKVSLDERTQYTLPDFFTINTDRLAALDGAMLEKLNRDGYLQLAIMVANSLGNIEWLIELKNRKRAAANA
ncbi:SapC family protein [Marinihelvus fidelis]|uniref:SapC family protein n=1 Tax=Marinihelvus fidelis TaxID=2613842 RepID=A0A5N0TAS5_9GAMM|nr:SapC family protein [Marinihelvus fidelis]KAA9130449.1 SapC family protein [Marinihelvus fidelis]